MNILKRYLFLLPCMILCFLLLPHKVMAATDKEVKILYIGNSHAKHSTQYLSDILSQCGYRSVIGTCYKSDTDLKYHYSSAIKGTKNHSYIKNTAGSQFAIENNSYSVAEALSDENWDYIILQDKILAQAKASSYYFKKGGQTHNLVDDFTSYIRTHSSAKLCWNVIWPIHRKNNTQLKHYWNGDSALLFSDILDVTKQEIYNKKLFDIYIWSGPVMERLYSSYLKSSIYKDGRHTSASFGSFASGMCIAKALGMDLSKVTNYSFYQPALSVSHIQSIRQAIQWSWQNPWSKNLINVPKKHPLKKPQLTIQCYHDQYLLSWSYLPNCNGYKLERYVPKKQKWVTVSIQNETSYSLPVSDVKKNSKWRVVALGDRYLASKASKPKRIKKSSCQP